MSINNAWVTRRGTSGVHHHGAALLLVMLREVSAPAVVVDVVARRRNSVAWVSLAIGISSAWVSPVSSSDARRRGMSGMCHQWYRPCYFMSSHRGRGGSTCYCGGCRDNSGLIWQLIGRRNGGGRPTDMMTLHFFSS